MHDDLSGAGVLIEGNGRKGILTAAHCIGRKAKPRQAVDGMVYFQDYEKGSQGAVSEEKACLDVLLFELLAKWIVLAYFFRGPDCV